MIVFSGSRKIKPSPYRLFALMMQNGINPEDFWHLEIFVGDATGVDEAIREAFRDAKVYTADWDAYGKAAGPKRNRAMLEDSGEYWPSRLVAFPGPDSRGTWSAIRIATELVIPSVIIPITNSDAYIDT